MTLKINYNFYTITTHCYLGIVDAKWKKFTAGHGCISHWPNSASIASARCQIARALPHKDLNAITPVSPKPSSLMLLWRREYKHSCKHRVFTVDLAHLGVEYEHPIHRSSCQSELQCWITQMCSTQGLLAQPTEVKQANKCEIISALETPYLCTIDALGKLCRIEEVAECSKKCSQQITNYCFF